LLGIVFDGDLDLNFLFDAVPDSDLYPTLFHLQENQKFFFDFYSEQCPDGNKKLFCLIPVLVEGIFYNFSKNKS
jgi:hypothetical protein